MRSVARLAPFALLAALGIAAYANSIDGAFVWDDNILIADNPVVKSWSTVPALSAKGFVVPRYVKEGLLYRPIEMITYIADYSIGGSYPPTYHITNLIFHILSSFAVFMLVSVLYRDTALAVFTGALFTVHPALTEAVSYISGRSDVLAALFMLAALLFYIRSLDGGPVPLALACALFVSALLSKEVSIIFPALIMVYHYSSSRKARIRMMAPFLAAAAVYVLFAVKFLNAAPPDVSIFCRNAIERVPGFFAALSGYLRLLVAPSGLHMDYGNARFNFTDWRVMSGAAVFIFFILCAVTLRRISSGRFTFGLLWFLVALVPYSGIYPSSDFMAERRLYLPSIGFFLVTASFFRAVYGLKRARAATTIAFCAILVVLLRLTIFQNISWKDPVDFYERTLLYSPGSVRANLDLALIYERKGQHAEVVEIYRELLKSGDPMLKKLIEERLKQ